MLNPYLERQRLIIVFVTVALNIAAMTVFARSPWSDWRTGMALGLFDNALLLAHVFRMRDLLMLRLMLFGLVVGLAKLGVDAWLVDATGTLDYTIGGGPMLWRSPVWAPLAWEIITVQCGYIGVRLYEAMGGEGLAVTGLFGALNLSFYEEMAPHARWWHHVHCRMFLHAPCYAILGGFLIAAALGRLATCARQRELGRVFTAGVFGGIAILASYAFAYMGTDVLWKVWR